jgi:hypothetical protein
MITYTNTIDLRDRSLFIPGVGTEERRKTLQIFYLPNLNNGQNNVYPTHALP